MSPSQRSLQIGVKLIEVSNQTGVSARTLINWHKNKPDLFEAVCIGAAKIIKEREDK